MGPWKRNLAVVGIVIAFIVATDIVGVIACSLLDIAPIRGKSSLAFYAIWSVLAIFCGLLSYNSAAAKIAGAGAKDWTNRDDARKVGWQVLIVSAITIVAITCLSAPFWSKAADSEIFVPDNAPLTLVFFGAMIAATFVANNVFLPSANK